MLLKTFRHRSFQANQKTVKTTLDSGNNFEKHLPLRGVEWRKGSLPSLFHTDPLPAVRSVRSGAVRFNAVLSEFSLVSS